MRRKVLLWDFWHLSQILLSPYRYGKGNINLIYIRATICSTSFESMRDVKWAQAWEWDRGRPGNYVYRVPLSSPLHGSCIVQSLNPSVCLARASGNPHGECIRLLQTRWGYRVPNGGWEALYPVLPTGLGQMLHSIPSKNSEPVEARYGAQRVENGDSTSMGPRVCPNSLRQGFFSPPKMISRELLHAPFLWHPCMGLCLSPFGSHPNSSMKLDERK